MTNPSKANSTESDPTINKVIEYFYKQPLYVENQIIGNNQRMISNIRYLYIANLFSLYRPKSKDLYKNIDQIISQVSYQALRNNIDSNYNVIFNMAKVCDYIVLAWGNCPDGFNEYLYFTRVTEILNLIKDTKKEVFVLKVDDSKRRKKYSLTKLGNPVHPINGKLIKLVKVKFNTYKGIIPV